MAFITIPDLTEGTQQLKQLKQKGHIVYEYNPLQVYRLNQDQEDGKLKNSIVSLDTDKLQFDLEHPVDIITQQSYDGSVNLILNDGLHEPKLINTRFSTTGMNTYQIVDREGDNDSNIYDEDTFDSETSLYKVPNGIVDLNFIGLGSNGNLKVGNYVFYFKLADADGNETDIVAESSIVSCHLGNVNDPFSIQGGLEDENSFKSVSFIISNIDPSYDHVTVYYTRNSSDLTANDVTLAYKVYEKFPIYNSIAKINITGFERAIEISLDELNMQYNTVANAKTQTTCQNMLFLGNISNNDLEYKELADLSLRFCPQISTDIEIGQVNPKTYEDPTGKYEYYNANNIYNYLGYWNDEIYRFGVVYILNNYTLSPVFNVRGIKELNEETTFADIPVRNDQKKRVFIDIDKSNYTIDTSNYTLEGSAVQNSKGVVRINVNNDTRLKGNPIGLKFEISKEAVEELKKYTKGFFFVRQKRIKTTFCQALTVGIDKVNNCPTIPVGDGRYMQERFLNDDRVLTHDFLQRQYEYDKTEVIEGAAGICPEFELNQPYFNQFFTGTEFIVNKIGASEYLEFDDGRGYYIENFKAPKSTINYKYNIVAVSDDIQGIKGKNRFFSSRAGAAEDIEKFAYSGSKNKVTKANNLLRGAFGPYIGLESASNAFKADLIEVKIPGYNLSSMDEYFDVRYRDASSFFAISDRIAWDNVQPIDDNTCVIKNIYRGDCYICNFSHRVIRNFQDSEAPTNDEIIEPNTWKDNYSVNETDSEEKRLLINRGDVNAVKIGHWITFKCCSSINLSLRTTNPYYPSEKGLTGRVRSFHPLQAMDVSGENKIPESALHNSGYNKSVGDKYYFDLPDVPAIKNKFHTRILYSDIAVNDAFKNGFRTFRGNNYRDYPLTYGSLIKMVEWYGSLVCIFEHGVATIPVNERAVASQSAGGNVFISTAKVLPENPNVLSDMFGTQWADSVVQTPYGIYGVDTVAKKIWKITVVKGNFQLITISDFKVQKFLVDNITLSEKETKPFIGIRNVKSHYNAYKNDIMFTFYDDINNVEEKAWNLCYNEVLERFITFYSWMPSFSANIDNIFFTFDRSTSRGISLLHNKYNLIKCSYNGVIDNIAPNSTYTLIGTLSFIEGEKTTSNTPQSSVSTPTVKYELCDDLYNGMFVIQGDNNLMVRTEYLSQIINNKIPTLWKIPIKATVWYPINQDSSTDIEQGITSGQIIEDNIIYATSNYLDSLDNTYFWKHGQAGLMKTHEDILPCNWYGKQHPFEFEVIALENPAIHKIFTDLQIISNKVAPESLHFEISGEVYSFADDKLNMFFRQEATKNLYQYYGGDIVFDSNYVKLNPRQRDIPYSSSKYKDKSTMFPIYYSRVNTINEIEDYYQRRSKVGYDYQRMSGSEIVYDKTTNQFNIATHIKGCPFNAYYKQSITRKRYEELDYEEYHRLLDEGQPVYTTAKVVREDLGESEEKLPHKDFRDLHTIVYIDEDLQETIMYIETLPNGSDISYRNLKFFLAKDWEYFEIKQYGRLNGNMHYKEDAWYIQVPSIVYWQSNEKPWLIPPINIANNPIPETMTITTIDKLPNNLKSKGYGINNTSFDNSIWKNARKETRIRDKYLRIKIRYTGSDLAIIYALRTMFTVSYA